MIDQHDDWLERADALRLLTVKPATLYSYVSRGLVRRLKAGRCSRYHRGDIETLVQRRGARAGHAAVANQALRWGPPVIDSAITRMTPTAIFYRGQPLERLIDLPFESVAELLWTGSLPTPSPIWPAGMSLAPNAVARPLDRMRAAVAQLPAPPPGLGAPLVVAHGRLLAATLIEALGLDETTRRSTLINRALVACADHGLNASTFTARVVASTGADLHACVGAALAALSGPRHGGACDRIEALLAHTNPAQEAAARLARGEAVPGFGHPLYPTGDPRTPPLLEAARAANAQALVKVDAVVSYMRDAGHPPAAVDLGLVAVAQAIGAPAGTAVALFALGRVAGWIAHVVEQQASTALLRPRARYIGVETV